MAIYLTFFLSFYLSCLTQVYAEEKPLLPLTTPLLSSTEASAFTLSATTGIVVPTTSSWLARAAQITQIHSQVTTSGLSLSFGIPNQWAAYSGLMRSGNWTGSKISLLGKVIPTYKEGLLGFKVAHTKQVYDGLKLTNVNSTYGEISLKEGRLVIEAAHTNVDTTYGKISLPSSLEVAHKISLTAGVTSAILGGSIDLISQLGTSPEIDWQRVGGMSVLSGISGYSGSLTGLMLEHALVDNQIQLFSNLVPTTLSASLLGSLSGGMVTTAIFAYGAYFLGYSDLNSANRSLMAGAIGSAASTLGVITTLHLVAAFGSASTGTAIASLSGAAAAKASLAWLGGGSLAAGGGGVAAGSAVLTAGAALVVIGIGAGVMYVFHLGDEKTERARVGHLLASVQQGLK